jgi:hypothetical protein
MSHSIRPVDMCLRYALGLVLLVSATYKLRNRSAYETALFVVLGRLRKCYKQIAAFGIIIELATGLALCGGIYPALTAFASVVLMLFFDATLIALRTSGYEGSCGCFGSNSSGGVTIWHFVRNAALSVAAGWLLYLRTR